MIINRSSCIIRRAILSALLFIACHFSYSQETKKFNIKFVVATGSKKYLKQVDSVSLRNEVTGEEWIFDKMQTKDSIFTIEDVELGKYRIVVYQKALVIPFVDFSACTLCRNKINMIAYTSTANKVFDRISIGPHYEGGFKPLSTDFLSALTKDEIKTLKKTDNKLKVKCFITADDKLSDVVFEQADLSAEIRSLIVKGFAKTRNWRSAISNGKPGEDYISLAVSKMID